MKKVLAGCFPRTLRNWPARSCKQNATPSSTCATKRPSTTKRSGASNVILIWPKPGFSGLRLKLKAHCVCCESMPASGRHEKALEVVLAAWPSHKSRASGVYRFSSGQGYADRGWPGRGDYLAGDGPGRLDAARRLHAGRSQRGHTTLHQSADRGADWPGGLQPVLPTLAAKLHQPRGHRSPGHERLQQHPPANALQPVHAAHRSRTGERTEYLADHWI